MKLLTKKEIKNVNGGIWARIATLIVSMRPDGDWVYNGGNHRTSNKL